MAQPSRETLQKFYGPHWGSILLAQQERGRTLPANPAVIGPSREAEDQALRRIPEIR